MVTTDKDSSIKVVSMKFIYHTDKKHTDVDTIYA